MLVAAWFVGGVAILAVAKLRVAPADEGRRDIDRIEWKILPEAATADANADALERLRLGMAYEYDPQVVETLTKVVARRIEHAAAHPTERSRQILA